MRYDFISAVCVICLPRFLPPNEMVIYGGETSREMYLIEKGKCLVKNKIKTIKQQQFLYKGTFSSFWKSRESIWTKFKFLCVRNATSSTSFV